MKTLRDYISAILAEEGQPSSFQGKERRDNSEEGKKNREEWAAGNAFGKQEKAAGKTFSYAVADAHSRMWQVGYRKAMLEGADELQTEAEESMIPQDQGADLIDDVTAKDEDGEQMDATYVDQLRRLAGIK